MPEIFRDRTWCRFLDASGVEWDVTDAWPKRFSTGTVERYPGEARAVARFFRRFTPLHGSQQQQLVEERQYTFRDGETRWLVADEFQRQLGEGLMTRA